MKLENKVAFLTGCGKGIGKRVAHRFGKEGAKCIVTGRNYSDIKEVAEEIKKRFPNCIIVFGGWQQPIALFPCKIFTIDHRHITLALR